MSITLPLNLLRKHKTDVFIETGTFDGGGVRVALSIGFPTIHSIESEFHWYTQTKQQFDWSRDVMIHYGSSEKVLPLILGKLKTRATFWLDAHEFGGGSSPLTMELACIDKHPIKDHIIMIDDRRVFHTWGLKEDKIMESLAAINPDYQITLENSNIAKNDIIVASVPPNVVPRTPPPPKVSRKVEWDNALLRALGRG